MLCTRLTNIFYSLGSHFSSVSKICVYIKFKLSVRLLIHNLKVSFPNLEHFLRETCSESYYQYTLDDGYRFNSNSRLNLFDDLVSQLQISEARLVDNDLMSQLFLALRTIYEELATVFQSIEGNESCWRRQH